MGCANSVPSTPESSPQSNLQVKTRDPKPLKAGPPEAKIVLLGDSGVGKSSLALRFAQGRFPSHHEVTIGAAFLQQTIKLATGKSIKYHIWDTGGQERFRSMAPLYYRDAKGALIVYDATDRATYESVQYWIDQLRSRGPPNCVLVVAANKSEDPTACKVDPANVAEELKAKGILFFETSAIRGDNVAQLFEALGSTILGDAV